MKSLLVAVMFVVSGALFSLETVQNLDPVSYMGTWYEIAKIPNTFQKDCAATKVQYKLLSSGKVDVYNRCVDKKNPSNVKAAKGIAKVVDKETNAKLKVSFVPLLKHFVLFAGDYWVLDLGQNYEYALVGSPTYKYLWILSRTPSLDEASYNSLVSKAKELGFNVSLLVKTPIWK